MEEETKPVKTGENQETRDAKGRFVKGVSGNPLGKPAGTEHFKTKFMKFLDKVAEQNEITAEEVEEQLMAVGYKEAKSGNYNFWKDLNDRLYGRPQSLLDVTTGGDKVESININILDGLKSTSEQGVSEELSEQE